MSRVTTTTPDRLPVHDRRIPYHAIAPTPHVGRLPTTAKSATGTWDGTTAGLGTPARPAVGSAPTRAPREQTTRICPDTARCASLGQARAIGAAVARFVHTEEVTGSNPVSPTEILFHLLALTRQRSVTPTERADPCSRRRKQVGNRASGAATGQLNRINRDLPPHAAPQPLPVARRKSAVGQVLTEDSSAPTAS